MNAIRTFAPNSVERNLLETAVYVFNCEDEDQIDFRVEETFFDYGQGWRWTTIIARKGNDSWQALTPADQERILNGDIVGAVRSALSRYTWLRRRA